MDSSIQPGHAPEPLRILRETPRWVVIDKPAGLLSVPGRGPERADCVARRVARAFPLAAGPLTVHRLDMDTSGAMLLALDAEAHRTLSMQFEARTVHKEYEALLDGRPPTDAGTVTLPIRLDVHRRPRQIHDPEHGRACRTDWRILQSRSDPRAVTLVLFTPHTGRSHQLRVHAAHELGLGCPILGDDLYGDPASAPRLALHATRLAFDDPEAGNRINIDCPWTPPWP